MDQQPLPIPVLYEDDNLIAVEKPSGLLVHAYKKETNERDHLLRRLKQQTGHYLYPVHRLDRPVSGVVLFGLNPDCVRELKSVWHHESTIKEYLALVKGQLTESGRFSFPLLDETKQKQSADTCFDPITVFDTVTLVRIRIKTGRKHQIRRHFSRRCANVIGDSKYGQGGINKLFKGAYGLNRIFLHAHYFKVHLPSSQQEIEIQSPLPAQLQHVLAQLHTLQNTVSQE